ncbi:bifunctional 3-deoxy-7-phosphoheptulonate synthase/chorismate mutase type II [Wenyingzhuangia sp. 2_MG-2023]|uniref:bifunctional 3-deoxy-7-phosphoheptulonate synthase/chorismate mutase type II n=1 Tax=Wenyingzhuangia sp. 2_MG-2023 TaxID=3062639 RepID=UPI0026E3C303|nr:bifunctional 3-deoxy-7-phosphoheptulonate synthase/chorismate mutase type II [Wenyingzhuangia sp. 2_MG-2023]MDO6737901.1 bifunctional 3-deoxy-7-phosphoheptulonate synthase/chorismate mutase type II [Wenyingzhuangia sp. 2_MG-2023]MDO6802745.1 bifunctional 3-deoxy-7-phosphoheptulonate synthase/chorismate mutase type II [Wenyingzhuangia sp. 1_MG-2023]
MENKKELRAWLDDMKLDHPLVIAGPCSAETEEQVLKIAHELKNTDATVFRAGVWKPRTRPGGFEGVGAVALPWLKKVKEQTGLLTAVEVANVAHVKLALEADVDILWLGARTTVNPFAVQEVADALEGTDKIVLIKNPINPDLALWLGGVERLYKANIKNLGVIHRGFSSYKKTKYRNVPQWQLPIELKRKFPDLPIINDPSHICGNRTGIQEISQIALDLNFEGLMIETHITPDEAWSDAAQQITPARLVEIMNDLKVRKPKAEGEALDQLKELRSEIDVIDNHLIQTLAERMSVAEQIGKVKKAQNVSVLQDARWGEILDNMAKIGEEAGLSEDFIKTVYKAIHQESINKQEEIVTSK